MIIIKVQRAPEYTRQQFQATLSEWDLGVPIGYGDTIQEALDIFLESFEMKYNQLPNYIWI